ncbi:hypothetical protein KKA14_01715, partial [bacterium]|nr:hypothetical protein [bacterium]
MENDTKTLRRFVLNFFENERYLNPDESRLSSGEMLAYHQNPKSAQTNRLLMDRVLNDPEFLETRTAADSDTSASEIATAPSNVHYLSEIIHRFPGAKRFKRVDK